MFGTDRLSVEDLDALTALLSADLKLKLVPGPDWAVQLPRIYYPRAKMLKISATEAVGKLWRTVQHAVDTRGELDGYDVAVDAVLAAEDLTGVRCVHPRFVLRLFLEAERERVERIARSRAANLEYTYLPKRGNGWRSAAFEVEREIINARAHTAAEWWERAALAIGAIASGTLRASDTPPDLEMTAIERRITALPNAPSYDALQIAVEALVPHLAAAYLRSIAEPEEEQPPRKQDDRDNASSDGKNAGGEGDANDDSQGGSEGPNGGKSGADDDTTEANEADEPQGSNESNGSEEADGEQPGDARANDDTDETPSAGDTSEATRDNAGDRTDGSREAGSENDAGGDLEDEAAAFDRDTLTRIASKILDAIAGELAELGDDALAIDYLDAEIVSAKEAKGREKARAEMVEAIADAIAAGGWGPTTGNHVNDPGAPGPPWSGVARTNIQLTGPLKRIIIQHLAENEVQELETGHTSGRLDMRRAFLPPALRPTPPFRRRAVVNDRSYAVEIVLDRSGSMIQDVAEERYPDVFGPGRTRRWHLAARMCVALTDAFSRIPNCDLGIITYDHHVDVIKHLGDPLSERIRQRAMDTVRARGDNDDAGALTTAVTELQRSPREKKIVIFLTDGQFCSSNDAMNRAMTIAKRASVETIFLTLDCEPDFARRYVPDHLAERVDDQSLPTVLARHLRRVIAA
jgi:von Willebrand factor type A domain